MDFTKEYIEKNEQAEREYNKWYAQLPDEKKAQFIQSAHELVAKKIRYDMQQKNPFATEADIIMRYIELTQKEDTPAEKFAFMESVMAKRSDKEWKARFSEMCKELDWNYSDLARFIGAKNGDSIKASVNRKMPAFAKLAVCVFEKMKGR